jgi:hypothetical protein
MRRVNTATLAAPFRNPPRIAALRSDRGQPDDRNLPCSRAISAPTHHAGAARAAHHPKSSRCDRRRPAATELTGRTPRSGKFLDRGALIARSFGRRECRPGA